MRRLTVVFGGVEYACDVDAAHYERHRRYIEGYLRLDPPAGPVREVVPVRLEVSGARYRRLLPPGPPDRVHTSFVNVPYHLWRRDGVSVYRPIPPASPDDHLFAVGPEGIEVVAREGVEGFERILRRIICDVAIRLEEDAGATMFHAACASRDGTAVMVIGPKGAGKTTTVTMLAGDGAMRLCGNDRTLVNWRTGRALGLPLAYRLGHGQVRSEPLLAGSMECGRAPGCGQAECAARGKHFFAPAELARALRTRIGTGGRLGAIVLPRMWPDDRPPRCEPAEPAQVEAELVASCYTPHDPIFKEPRFRARASTEAALAAAAAEACRMLAARVPAYRMDWGMGGDLAAVRRELRQTVGAGILRCGRRRRWETAR